MKMRGNPKKGQREGEAQPARALLRLASRTLESRLDIDDPDHPRPSSVSVWSLADHGTPVAGEFPAGVVAPLNESKPEWGLFVFSVPNQHTHSLHPTHFLNPLSHPFTSLFIYHVRLYPRCSSRSPPSRARCAGRPGHRGSRRRQRRSNDLCVASPTPSSLFLFASLTSLSRSIFSLVLSLRHLCRPRSVWQLARKRRHGASLRSTPFPHTSILPGAANIPLTFPLPSPFLSQTVALNSADLAGWGGGYPSAACGQWVGIEYQGKTVYAEIQGTFRFSPHFPHPSPRMRSRSRPSRCLPSSRR